LKNENPTKKNQRIDWLDSLRGVAILLVALYHFTARYPQKYGWAKFADAPLFRLYFGWTGVELFFMISGFIIYLSIQNKKGPAEFLTARLSRLVPPYWAAIVIMVAIEPLHAMVFSTPLRHAPVDVAINLTMATELVGAPLLDGVFWTLFVELRFYILFAVVWQFVDLRKRHSFYASYLLVLAAASGTAFGLPLGGDFILFPIFWLGIGACKLWEKGLTIWEFMALGFITTLSTSLVNWQGREIFVAIPVFCALFLLSQRAFLHAGAAKILRPLALLGRISYSFYLLHSAIGYIILGWFSSMGLSFNLAIATALATSASAAAICFFLVEKRDKPIAAFINSKLSGARLLRYRRTGDAADNAIEATSGPALL